MKRKESSAVRNTQPAAPAPCPRRPGGQKPRTAASGEALDSYPLGMAYVPWQTWGSVFTCEDALSAGTLFPDLLMPYCGGRGKCHG